ncbi:winged helix-turn-helix domain-containing protein [Streptomyces sp. NPDC021749]|uniref:ArsR/SmtB family transcription factor n=1 Tax=Streptomyces sp. NPDC021749 TaxID=3154905 RepID=UPI0033ECCE80
MIPASGYAPDFLNPAPPGPAPALREELAAIMATPADRVRRDLDLIPSAFKGPGLSTRVAPPDPPQLAYRARGVGALWERRPAARTAAVSAVLGRSRTLLLIELETPATTTELAQRTGISMAGVSQNLTALRTAGFVSAHRTGRSVLYARTSVAESVLAAGP